MAKQKSIFSPDEYFDLEDVSITGQEKNSIISEHVNDVLKKSIIQSGFEKLERVPGCLASIKQRAIDKKEQKAKCKGPNWFNMTRPTITSEIENDLKVLKMRSALDPKHFYKKNDIKGLPKYFQVGKYVDNPADFYSSRLPKKQRKRTIVEELMADVDFQKYNSRKHKEIVTKNKRRSHTKAHQLSKRLKKGKKR